MSTQANSNEMRSSFMGSDKIGSARIAGMVGACAGAALNVYTGTNPVAAAVGGVVGVAYGYIVGGTIDQITNSTASKLAGGIVVGACSAIVSQGIGAAIGQAMSGEPAHEAF